MEHVDADWLRARLTGERGEKKRLAEYLGIAPNKITKILNGERQIRGDEVLPLMEYFNEIPEPVRVPGPDQGETAASLVSVFDVHASAGHGALVEHEEPEAYSLAFPPRYLSKLTSSSPKNLAIIGVKGDSMEPTLNDDDIVLLDMSKTDLSWDGLFVLRYDNALHVKRVSRSPQRGSVRIMSDNRLYDPIDLPAEEVTPIGKVLWYGRKV